MNKAIKWGLIICASLVVLVIAALLIAPAFIDIRDYKPELEGRRGIELPDSVRMGQRLTGMTSKQETLPIAPSIF